MADSGFSIRQVRGDIASEVAKLRRASRRKLRAKVRKVLMAETKTARSAIKKGAREGLPGRGGLNKWAAVTPVVSSSFDGPTARVSIVMKKSGHDLAALDAGEVRHPLYGNRGTWIKQSIRPGFFTDAIARESDDMARRVADALLKFSDDA